MSDTEVTRDDRRSARGSLAVRAALGTALVTAPVAALHEAAAAALALSLGALLLPALREPRRGLARLRALGPAFVASLLLQVLALTRGLFLGAPPRAVLVDAALAALPLAMAWLGPWLFGARANRTERRRFASALLVLGTLAALWLLGRELFTDLPRRELGRGLPYFYPLVATAIGWRRLLAEPDGRGGRILSGLAVGSAGLAYLAHASRAPLVLWTVLLLLALGRAFGREPARRLVGALGGAALLLVVGAWLVPGSVERLGDRFVLAASPAEDLPRWREARTLWTRAREDPLGLTLGHGFGAAYSFQRRGHAQRSWTGRYTHSLPTHALWVGGLPAVLAVLALGSSWLRLAWRRTRDADATIRGLADGLLLGLVWFLVFSGGSGASASLLVGLLVGALAWDPQAPETADQSSPSGSSLYV